MAISTIVEPQKYINLYTDYYFKYSSDISTLINFKYKIEVQQKVASVYTTSDTFLRFPEPDGTVSLNLRQYLTNQIETDYFVDNYSKANGVYNDVITNDFRLKITEGYAYQFPYGIFNSTGGTISNGVSANAPKYYNLYDLKLTYSATTGSNIPIYKVGDVVQIIDNSDPIINLDNINGIYTILEVGSNYVVVNGIYNSSITYFTGSILYADKRQVFNTSSAVTSNIHTSVNSCKEDYNQIYTSLPNGYNLRGGSKLLLPLINYSGVTVIENATTKLSTSQTGLTNNLLVYTVPSTAATITITTVGSGATDTKTFNIISKCDIKFQKTTLNFVDRTGAFVPFYFDLANVKSIDITNTNWNGLDASNRSTKYQIGTTIREKFQLTTDWLDEKENSLFEELMASNHIYMFFEDSSTPQKVLILDKSYSKKKTQTSKLFNYTLNVELAREKFTNN